MAPMLWELAGNQQHYQRVPIKDLSQGLQLKLQAILASGAGMGGNQDEGSSEVMTKDLQD